MATALVLQTWFDIAIQHTGRATNAFAIAFINNRSVTDALVSGETIFIPSDLSLFTKEVKYLESKKAIPATGITKDGLEIISPTLGIGTMAIGTTFIVG
ncbi:MAG: hypothetical protein V4497_01205 [Bacteroidota bacterium]